MKNTKDPVGLIEERDWFASYSLDIDLDELLVWARKAMLATEGQPSLPIHHDTGLWWETSIPPKLKERLERINPLDDAKSTFIWEFHDGKELNRHTDSGKKLSFIVLLIGSFELYSYDENDHSKRVDSYIYKPGMILALKNGHIKPHDGICLDGYRLAMTCFIDPNNNPYRDK